MSALDLVATPLTEPDAPARAPLPSPRAGTISVSAPTRELLTWIADSPRTYGETMAAWRSHCPRLTVWEDALDAGLVRVERKQGHHMAEARVTLTPDGQSILAGM